MLIVVSLYIIIGVALFAIYYYTNYAYRHTNAYINELLPANKLCNVPCHLQVVNFGSTYAMHAFNCYEELKLNGFSFAMNCQSIEIDNVLLHKYQKNIEEGATCFFCLAACVPFFRYYMTADKRPYYEYMETREIPKYSVIERINQQFPLWHKTWRSAKKIIKDDPVKKDVTNNFPYHLSDEQARYNMLNLVNCWKTIFQLKDLSKEAISRSNIENLQFNARLLMSMVEFCRINKWQPVFVIPPFSAELNKYFYDDFIKSSLYELIKPCIEKYNVSIYDYRTHKDFQHDKSLFCDGGFLLSKYGSKKFIRLLLSQMAEPLNNSTLRKL